MHHSEDLQRIETALELASSVLRHYAEAGYRSTRKSEREWVTEADLEVDELLRKTLLRDDEGWLSEETKDTEERLERTRVWVVDPLDGTREFMLGIPEWCVSIGLVVDGEAVAGGICNPATGLSVLGAKGTGCWTSGARSTVRDGANGSYEVLASRSEVGRGEWAEFVEPEFRVVPTGSVALKFALVAAGLTDMTWTLTPKNEWDVAAGVALVHAAGGVTLLTDGNTPTFNRPDTLLPGIVACGRERMAEIRTRLSI